MCELFKNVENSICYKGGDIITLRSIIGGYSDVDFYVVISNYAWYAYDVYNNNTKYKIKVVHLKKFNYKEVFLFGGWKVKCKSILTGKYKFFKEEDIISIEDTYVKLQPGYIRNIKLKLLNCY